MWQNGKIKVSRDREVKLVSSIGDVKKVKTGVNPWVHVPKRCCLPPQLTPAPALVISEVLTKRMRTTSQDEGYRSLGFKVLTTVR